MVSILTRCFVRLARTAIITERCCLHQQLPSKFKFQPFSVTSKTRQRINVGVIGGGRISEIHVSNVLANRKLSLKWVVERDETRAKQLEELLYLDDIPFYREQELSRLLDDQSLQGVIILTPIPTHTDLSCQALEKGKAVLVEKPAGESIEDSNKVFDVAEKNNTPFVVGFNRRFDPTFAKVREEVIQGSVGKLQYIHLTTRDSPKPSYDFLKNCDEGGCSILTDLAVHDIDHLVWVTQADRPEHIYVTTHGHDKMMAEFGEADSLAAVIKYKCGVIATINASRESVYGYDIRSEVFGSEGMISAGNPRYASTVLDQAHGGTMTRLCYSFPQRFEASFKAELEHFCDCVQGKATPLITREESAMVAEIVTRGLESFQSKKPVYF